MVASGGVAVRRKWRAAFDSSDRARSNDENDERTYTTPAHAELVEAHAPRPPRSEPNR